MKQKIAFLTTIFPMSPNYLNDFFTSLEKQTYKQFDLVIVNDNYNNFKEYIQRYPNLSIVELICNDTPAKNREYGINYIIENGYDILIFGDSDDYFSENRVEKSIRLLQIHDIVVNDVSLFDENGIYEKQYFSHRIANQSMITYEFIKNKNIFGLTNTAVNVDILETVSFPSTLVAVDWIFFKRLLKAGIKAVFTNEIVSFYRQYDTNVVGLNSQNSKYLFWWEEEKNK